MDLYLNRNGGIVSQSQLERSHVPLLEIKREKRFDLQIFVQRDQIAEQLPVGSYVKFVLKALNDFDGDAVAQQSTNTAPAEPIDPWELTVDLDTVAIRSLLGVDGVRGNDKPSVALMGEILTSPDGTDGSWTPSLTLNVTLDNRVSQDEDAGPAGAPGTHVEYLPAVSGYIGGTSDKLDSTVTVGLAVPRLYNFVVGGVDKAYRLETGTDATDSSAFTVIRPVDYDGATNTKVFRQVSLIAGALTGTFPIGVSDGGTGSTTAAGARTNLGLAIGSDVQAYNAGLAAFSGLSLIADRLPYASGTGTLALATFTSFGRSLAAAANGAAGLALVGGQASNSNLSALSGLTLAADKLPYATGAGALALTTLSSFARTFLDDADAATVRATLGLTIGTNVQIHNANLDTLGANTPGATVTLNNITLVLSAVSGNGSALTSLNASNFTSGTVPAARGGAGAVTGLMKANGSGVVTAAVPGVDYLAPGGGALGVSGETQTFIMVSVTNSAATNGANLRSAYTAAKALTPGGSPITATNRARVVVPPGVYNLVTTPLGMDGEYVDLVGLTGNPSDVLITSQVTAGSSGTVVQTANDVHLHGVTIQNTASTRVNTDGSDASAYAYGGGGSSATTVMEDCILDDGGNQSWSMQLDSTLLSTFRRVTAGDYAFAGGVSGTFNGTADGCTGGANAFAGDGGICSGALIGCTGGTNSFGGNNGGFTGVAINCAGGAGAFGGGVSGTLSGKLYYCRMTSGTFPTGNISGGGAIYYGSDSNTLALPNVLQLAPNAGPGSPVEGMIYPNSGDHHLYFYNGSAWVQLDN